MLCPTDKADTLKLNSAMGRTRSDNVNMYVSVRPDCSTAEG
jgi:hypothetical protein